MHTYRLKRSGTLFRGVFQAMACRCEILLDGVNGREARQLVDIAYREARRIECRFSRYRSDNIVFRINHAEGRGVRVDRETAELLDFAAHCHRLSEGLFDITSGILGRVWTFDGSNRLPEPASVDALLPLVGWQRVCWQRPLLSMPKGMQIDLGGIGKEYAVDRVVQQLKRHTAAPVLVNFGGDLHASAPPEHRSHWRIGLEHTASALQQVDAIGLSRGALATSGDRHRYIESGGRRYSHVLDPKTGWPVPDAPCTVTVASNSCIEAGVLSTLALLKGAAAEDFLAREADCYWLDRPGVKCGPRHGNEAG